MAAGRGRGWVRSRLRTARPGAWLAGTLAAAGAAPAGAAEGTAVLDGVWRTMSPIEPHGPVGLALFLGVVTFAAVTAIMYVRERGRWMRSAEAATEEIARLRAESDRADLLLIAESQFVVAFDGRRDDPQIEGDVGRVTGGVTGRRALAFGTWAPPEAAQRLDASVTRLKRSGEPFRLLVPTLSGGMVEAEGKAVAGRAVLRCRDVGTERRERLKLEETLAGTVRELDLLRGVLAALPHPIWMRDGQRRLAWVNPAYAVAVEAADPADAVKRDVALLDARQRAPVEDALAAGRGWAGRVPAVIGGRRGVVDVVEAAVKGGGGGIAVDRSELEAVRADLERQMQSHVGTLDQLPTAVAIFDERQRLVFQNQAYRELWGLDQAYLESQPLDGEILERLRVERRLPEQADFRSWKSGILEAYRSLETRQWWWYLPDNRRIRVVARPNPQGGVTYLYDDVTERFRLESQVSAMTHVQRETLDSLREGVALFGSDGRLKLFNTTFASIWKLPPEVLKLKPHIDEVIRIARILAPDDPFWPEMASTVAGLRDARTLVAGRINRNDGAVLDCAIAPLPDGAALLTFTDVTASVRIERALTERNEALQRINRLRDDFIQHVSYELRSPLTSIIGFTQALGNPRFGTLNERQSEYCGHIMRSSAALLVMINDILDLASLDMGELELAHEPVDIGRTIEQVVEAVQDRLAEANLAFDIEMPEDSSGFVADPKRLRQVLFNLMSNAIGFSEPGQRIAIRVSRSPETIAFSVTDHGRGIPEAVKRKVFERFESHTAGSRHRGAGLGLSIVHDFVHAHGGTVDLVSEPGRGTTVTCVFPLKPATPARAAEARDIPKTETLAAADGHDHV